MPTIKSIVVKNMKRISLLMAAVIFILSTVVLIFDMQQTSRQNALRIFAQVEQILEENAKESEQVRKEYEAMCLNDARTVAYILEYNPSAGNDVAELKKIAANVEVDEIHIFNPEGVIVSGTHPEYFGLSFDSGEQMEFFKPLLADKTLELVQDITPNTAEGKLVQYSGLWSEDGEFIVQIGMYPSTVLRLTEKNELSYIFSLLRTGVGYELYAIDPELENVVGATVASELGRGISEIGFQTKQLISDDAFYTKIGQMPSYCLSRRIGANYIVWAAPVSSSLKQVAISEALLLAALLLTSLILIYAVTDAMNRAVINPIKRINQSLAAIQEGDLTTKVSVEDSREFQELSAHINGMLHSLLQNAEELARGAKIKVQKEELERQHEQMETAMERSEAANKAKSEFLFNMSHDIRTPMNAIIGFTDLALESGDLELQKEYLEKIGISSRQLLDIIDNILELSRIEKRELLIKEELIGIREVFYRLDTVFDTELKEKHLSYTVGMDIVHPYVYVDTTYYSQIFLNVIGNAIKYTPDGGEIRVLLKELPSSAPDTCLMETVVEDNGIGISAEFLPHVMESFCRERNSTISGIQGTGLGLAIVKNLVDMMKGTISIESRQGEGTRVTVRLPLRLGDVQAAGKPAPELPEEAFFEGRRILLAEDIDVNAMIVTKILSGKKLLIERAKDGSACVNMLEAAENGYYDLILMDIQMPNMDGYEATRAIRALAEPKKASIPILALTANAFQEDREKAMDAGMDGHVAKPINAATLFRAIADALQDKNTR